ncbi:hypothetical protein BDU57DRAFT_531385 [Ampelomyces quisqualis]|uniref:Uncharacterized protein n=1 Tax=Ampelomyces quisqualis TaxID=50730 RepID=A0A6A5QK00_AMPQU|nr:hypothetical protein BDU57DRAFT_531385 [Ampelomyces quisqualis]
MGSGIANMRLSRSSDANIRQSTLSTTSDAPFDPSEDWVNVKIPREDAAAYLIGEILEWFKERGIDIEAQKAEAELEDLKSKHKHRPWYRGGYKGVRIDRAIMHHCKMLHESFRMNPYGLGAPWFWFILAAQLLFLFGNILGGLVDAWNTLDDDDANHWIPVLKGGVAALPMVWMLTMFLFPPLIANAKDQFAVYGHRIDG